MRAQNLLVEKAEIASIVPLALNRRGEFPDRLMGNGACHTGNYSCFFRSFGPSSD